MLKINYTNYLSKAKNFRQRFLVLHYTALNFDLSVKALTKDVSAHYLVPTLKSIDPTYPNNELIVYSLVPETDRAWHAGVSKWKDRSNLNDTSIGIEIVNMATEQTFVTYPPEQVDCIIELCKNILERYPDIAPTNVVAHSDISPGRKMDPGPLFPWKQLYDNGIGAWYDQKTVDKYTAEFTIKMPSQKEVSDKLIKYGYRYTGAFSSLLISFQMRFRPEKYNGILDVQTAAIIFALAEKY